MRGRDKFSKCKPIISMLCLLVKIFPKKMRKTLFYKARYKKGILGILKRYILLKSIAPKCGDNVSVHEGVFILNPENFSCGSNVSIHPMCYIDATGGIFIGNDVSVAHGATIMSTTHTFNDKDIPIKEQEVIKKKTIICDDVWIGAKATIIAGNKVNSNCIIGAGAVITTDCEGNSIMAGVPGKKIKSIE